MIDKAIALALKVHSGKVDLAGKPYILHCLRVASKFTGDEEMYAAAVLHDIVEDSSIRFSDIATKFTPTVAAIVDGLTKRKGEFYLEDYIPRCAKNRLATVIKIADIHDNLDPNRMLALTPAAIGRVKKYHAALKILMGD